jgi:hypothetical protein
VLKLLFSVQDLGIIKVKNFPFPTSPDEAALEVIVMYNVLTRQ